VVKKLLVILSMLLCVSCVTDWNRRDQILLGSYSAMHMVDIKQTREILSSPDYYEMNPILDGLTPNQATAVMLGSTVAFYFILDWLSEDWRTPVLLGANMLKFGLIQHNYSIGLEW
jgi:hypothetical protein